VVGKNKPLRRFVCWTLRKRPELQIVGEASGGVEAFRKAEELHPDLILLEIGLPTLHGIEAARQMRKCAPESKIVFLSHESGADMVQQAFEIGAGGYIAKTMVASDLLHAVEAVRKGKRFVSAGLSGYHFSELSDLGNPRPPQ